MELEAIIYEKEASIATITLNRPQRLNAVGGTMSEELQQALEDANSDDEVRVLIITGAGKGFCSGADVTGLGTLADVADAPWRLSAKSPAAGGIRSFVVPFYNFEKPTIAAVNGVAAGGGFSIALACDIRIASDRARFSQIFIRRGLVPDTGSTYFLPRVVGMSKACEMVFTGEVLDAAGPQCIANPGFSAGDVSHRAEAVPIIACFGCPEDLIGAAQNPHVS